MGKIGDLFVRLGIKTGDFKRGLDEAQSKTKSFGQQAGQIIGGVAARFASVTLAVAGFIKVLGNSLRTIKDFERANSTLASVLGTNKKGISDLTDAAIRLGKETMYTASQVTELQTSLARLGFNKEQIKNMQEPVLKFAAAVDTDLASAADFAGAALRAFGLQSDDTSRMLNIMAASTAKSALSFSKLQTGIGTVAPIAKAFGMTAEDTAAILGVLANGGIDASTSATALRNMLSKLADPASKISKLVKTQVKDLPTFLAALDELKKSGADLGTIAEGVDARALAAFTTLMEGTSDVRALRLELGNCNGALEDMYATMTDNLQGALDSLSSAWEGFILKLRNSTGPLKNAVNALADLVNWIGYGAKDNDKQYEQYLANELAKKYASKGKLSKRDMAKYNGYVEQGLITPNATGWETRTAEDGKTYNYRRASDQYGVWSPWIRGEEYIPPKVDDTGETTTKKKILSAEELEKIEKRRLETLKQESEALAAEREEYDRINEEAGEEFRRMHDLPPIQPFDNDVIATAAHNFKLVTDELDKADAEAKQLQEDIDAAFNEAFDKLTKGSFEVGDLISGALTAAVQGFSDCVQELANSLMQVGELDSSALTKALLDPLCDMAKQMGEVMMTMAAGMIAVKTSIDNPYLLLAAGAALVAIGAAGKAALASITAGGGSTSSAAGTTTTSVGSTTAENMEMTIHIEGKLKGSDIVLAGQRTQTAWGR